MDHRGHHDVGGEEVIVARAGAGHHSGVRLRGEFRETQDGAGVRLPIAHGKRRPTTRASAGGLEMLGGHVLPLSPLDAVGDVALYLFGELIDSLVDERCGGEEVGRRGRRRLVGGGMRHRAEPGQA